MLKDIGKKVLLMMYLITPVGIIFVMIIILIVIAALFLIKKVNEK